MTDDFKALMLTFKQIAKDRGEPKTMEKIDELVRELGEEPPKLHEKKIPVSKKQHPEMKRHEVLKNTKRIEDKKIINKTIDVCVPSSEMRNYLKAKTWTDYELVELIFGSPIKLEDKLKCLFSINDSKIALEAFGETYNALVELKNVKDGEMLIVHDCRYDYEFHDENSDFYCPCLDYTQALYEIRELMGEEEWDGDTLCWTRVEKWIYDDCGIMIHWYTYYFIGDEVVYFESHDPSSDHRDFRGYVDSISLHLPVPFKPGDIITLDVRPFAPVNIAVITETDNNLDCCGTQILYPNENGKYSSFAIMHGHGFGEEYFPILSSLYRAEKYEGELKGKKEILKTVSEFVKAGEGNGRKLYDDLGNIDVTGEAISEYIKSSGEIVINNSEDYKRCCNICGKELKEDEYMLTDPPEAMYQFNCIGGFGSVFDCNIFSVCFCTDCFDKFIKSCKVDPFIKNMFDIDEDEFVGITDKLHIYRP